MIAPRFPENENERLISVRNYELLDTLPDINFDNITALASAICEAPISLITLLDINRNFFKSHHGIDLNESPRDISFCGHAILEEDIFTVQDAKNDERFVDNPLVTEQNARFYAGVPLKGRDGFSLGTLCVFDKKPRTLTSLQKDALISLAKQVENLFELHRANIELLNFQTELKERNSDLKRFASVVSHDLKSPLANIMALTQIVKDDIGDSLSDESSQLFTYIEDSSEKLKNYIDAILKHYKTDELVQANKETVSVKDLFEEIIDMLIIQDSKVDFPSKGVLKNVNKAILSQILLNLIDNALKYNNKDTPAITIRLEEDSVNYIFYVEDNGIGIDEDKQKSIFNLFQTTGEVDRNGKTGTGVGLSTVKNLVEKLKGTISVSSKKNIGTTFKFSVQK